ncbi:MAG: hypothetical protein O6930_04735 [Gammaproteobacteria bacterium]|nr:hypothetical protein [Gammaproteobacteria bacterium]
MRIGIGIDQWDYLCAVIDNMGYVTVVRVQGDTDPKLGGTRLTGADH